jgi:hypothetical protein
VKILKLEFLRRSQASTAIRLGSMFPSDRVRSRSALGPSASSLGKHPDSKPDDPNDQNRSHPDSGFENISG